MHDVGGSTDPVFTKRTMSEVFEVRGENQIDFGTTSTFVTRVEVNQTHLNQLIKVFRFFWSRFVYMGNTNKIRMYYIRCVVTVT